jgi:hypothetical protein
LVGLANDIPPDLVTVPPPWTRPHLGRAGHRDIGGIRLMTISSPRTVPIGRIRYPALGVLLPALLFYTVRNSAGAYFVYVTFQSGNAIGVYQMDPDAGTLDGYRRERPGTPGP